MRKILLIIYCLSLPLISPAQVVQTGIEVLAGRDFIDLQGKRVGLSTNPTGVNAGLKSTIDILYEASQVDIVALYGPEHGVRGDYGAGDHVSSKKDDKT
jgi:uncharacterized protein YbbC (DUF1343 family)